MSWLPSFINPWTALIAAGAAVPLLLILYFLKLRRREMEVSSTLLWKKAIQDLQVNAPFQKLRRNLLLFLQMLLLLLLCLALSRPVVNRTPSAGKLTVILIDRSASMSTQDIDKGRSRLDEAKGRAKELVDTLSRDSAAAVIAFDESAEMVQAFTSDANLLKTQIDSIQQTDRKSRLKVAYKMAEAQATFNEAQLRANVKPDVFLYSDGRVLDAMELRLTGELHYDPIGTELAGNIGIVALSAKRNYERPTQVQIFARLANYGPEVVRPMVELTVDGQVVKVAATVLLPERWDETQRQESEKAGVMARDSVDFTMELTSAAVVKVEQTLKEGDLLRADDAAYVVVPPPKNLRLLLVTEGHYFLENMVRALGVKDPQIMTPTAYEAAFDDPAKDPSQFDVILFDRYSPRRLTTAGSYMYFGGIPPDLKLGIEQDAAGVNVMITEPSDVLNWRRDHPITRDLHLHRVYAAEMNKLKVPPEAEILVEGMRGPMIVLYREGRRTHLVFAFDLWKTNWPTDKTSFPVFMYYAVQYMAIGSDMDVRQSYSPGATPRIPIANLQRVNPTLKRLRITGPINVESDIPVTGDFALPALDYVGIYRTDPPIPPYEAIAVNLLDANESNLIPASAPPGGVGENINRTSNAARMELWWWIIAAVALPLLMIEWWVYTRRVHL